MPRWMLNWIGACSPAVPTATTRNRKALVDVSEATYFVGREIVSQGELKGMHPVFEHLFVLLHRGADSASRFFNLPPDRVFEVGTQVEL